MAKLILTLPTDRPNVRMAPISTDPTTPNYTAFSIHHSQTGELLNTFRADDIVQQRGFMAALGGKDRGLFSQPPHNNPALGDKPQSPTTPLQHLALRQHTYNKMSQNSQLPEICKNIPKSFQEAIQKFPNEFYFPNFELATPQLPGVKFPEYNPTHDRASHRRPRKVNFRPPHGPPTNYHSMIGCGAAAGLEPGQIAVWDQENEFYYFLDCNRKTVSANDPRQRPGFKQTIRKSQITVQKRQDEKHLSLPPCDPAVVHATAERASRKPHGCVLRACGKVGKHGMSAIPSADGSRGIDSTQAVGSYSMADGTDGSNGTAGDNGRHAELGEDGGIGKNVIVELYGDAKELGISGTCMSVARLGGEEYEDVLLVDCSGGDGGDGGNGGNGGRGGDGGDGGKGQKGGNGGHGGKGGAGGRGGNGGSGGNGGRGGNCVVRAADPRLLMLVEINCDSGRPGEGGRGGSGGRGGKMGYGGAGSSDDPSSPDAYSGLQGKPGMSGSNGEDGIGGELGFTHGTGNLQWVITSKDGEVELSSTTRFEAEVLSMHVSSCPEGGVFEPHQHIQVTDVVVVNSGGLPLPAGAKVSIPSTDLIRFEPTTYVLPQLEPAEQFVIPVTFRGQLADEPSPNVPGPLTRTCRFAPRVDLLGRPFEKSRLEQTFTVQYPIRLAYALAKKNMGQGEVTTLEVGIENTSSVPYGACRNSGGSVLIHVLLDSNLRPLGLAPSSDSTSSPSRNGAFAASYDPNHSNSVFILVKHLKPGTTLTVPIVVQMEREADLNDTCKWQTEVYLRGKLIEYSSAQVRVTPEYNSGDSPLRLADVLLIKTDRLNDEEMQFWQKIFELLGVTVDYWDPSGVNSDVQDSNTDSSSPLFPPFLQEYNGKLVVFPHCELAKLTTKEIITHFKNNGPHNKSRDSSMLLFLDTPAPASLEEYIQHNKGNKNVLRHLCRNEEHIDLPAELYSGCHLVSPGTVLPSDWTLKKAQKGILKKLQQETLSQAPVMVGQSSVIRRQGMTYSYGKLDVKRCPLSRTSNFQCVDGAASQMIQMGADDPYLTFNSTDVPLASNFGQVFLATLAGLPLQLKLNLLRQSLDASSPLFVQFCLPNGATLTKKHLAAVCLANDIADQVMADSSDLTSMHTLVHHMQDVCSSTNADTTIFTQLLDLIKREANQRQSQLGSQVSRAVKGLLGVCSSAAQHLPSSSSSAPAESATPLPRLSQLQSKLAVLRPHQITTDELFDLSH